jgi:hypothetical protein
VIGPQDNIGGKHLVPWRPLSNRDFNLDLVGSLVKSSPRTNCVVGRTWGRIVTTEAARVGP